MFDNFKRRAAGQTPSAPAPARSLEEKAAAVPAGDLAFVQLFNTKYAPRLGMREESFRIMLEKLERSQLAGAPVPLIVETGSMRQPDNWEGDGQSTLLWAAFSEVYPSEIHTVDLAPEAAALVRERCGDRVHAHTGDSVAFLHQLACQANPRKIDLLYLDSFDFDVNNPFPSAFHHVKELIAVRPCLGPGSIIAIDDNFQLPDGSFLGKGYLAKQWFDHLGITCLYQGYQWVWQL